MLSWLVTSHSTNSIPAVDILISCGRYLQAEQRNFGIMSPTFGLLCLVNVDSLQSDSGRPRMLKLCSFNQMTRGTSLLHPFSTHSGALSSHKSRSGAQGLDIQSLRVPQMTNLTFLITLFLHNLALQGITDPRSVLGDTCYGFHGML